MSDFLRDGTGSGKLAKVTLKNRLSVDAKTSYAEEIAAQNERAHIAHGVCDLSANSSGGFLSFKNTSSDVIFAISRIYIDTHSLTDNLLIYQVKNPTISTTGLDISTAGVVNKHFASARVPTVELYVSRDATDLTYTGGSIYHAFPVQTLSQYQRDMRGTNILAKNEILVFGWAVVGGGTAQDGEQVSFSINFYEVPVEEVTG